MFPTVKPSAAVTNTSFEIDVIQFVNHVRVPHSAGDEMRWRWRLSGAQNHTNKRRTSFIQDG